MSEGAPQTPRVTKQRTAAEAGKEGTLGGLGAPSSARLPAWDSVSTCPRAFLLIILGTLGGCMSPVLENRRMGRPTLILEDLCPSVASMNI